MRSTNTAVRSAAQPNNGSEWLRALKPSAIRNALFGTPTPTNHKAVHPVAAANAVLEQCWSRSQSVNAPRLQRLLLLTDRACMMRLGRRLTDRNPAVVLDMPYHAEVSAAFRSWGIEPIRRLGNHDVVAFPHVAAIDDERMAVMEDVVEFCSRFPTHAIPREVR